MKRAVIQKLEKRHLKSDIPAFKVGDTLKIHTKIVEGDKERVQVFSGTVIARKGTGLSETFSLHRVAFGEGMERVFPLHSPRIAKIEVMQRGDVRRSKLYYLRGTHGKKSKVKALYTAGTASNSAANTAAVQVADAREMAESGQNKEQE